MTSSTDAPIDSETDFEELSTRLRTQSADAPGSDTERVTIRSLEDVSTDSPAVVIGAMVIAPLLGPALAANVGIVTGDDPLKWAGFRYQLVEYR